MKNLLLISFFLFYGCKNKLPNQEEIKERKKTEKPIIEVEKPLSKEEIQAYINMFPSDKVLPMSAFTRMENPELLNLRFKDKDLLFYKFEGDMGSTVFYHPNQKPVLKMQKKEKYNELESEYKLYKKMLSFNLPIPHLYGFYKLDFSNLNIARDLGEYSLVTKNEGLPLNLKVLLNNHVCKEVWIKNLVKSLFLLAKNGYIQTDWSNIANFIINDDDNVFIIDIASINRRENSTPKILVQEQIKKISSHASKICPTFNATSSEEIRLYAPGDD